MDIKQQAVQLHTELAGKLNIVPKKRIRSQRDLSLLYTPGVGEPCKLIAEQPDLVFNFTSKWNMVAVVTDGSAVLGLGNIGAEAGLPVMEGKAVLFKEFGGVDAFPICLACQDTEEIIRTVEYISPTFGGINLEDISAPRCFDIEDSLKKRLPIPVFHDDQHGTAVVTLAALINALKIIGKKKTALRIVINGAGSAGITIAYFLMNWGVKDIVICDSLGIISPARKDLNPFKANAAQKTNPRNISGVLHDALRDADVFVGVSGPSLLSADSIRTMAKDPIVCAMANPDPEILPAQAKAGGAKVIATGRSDFPNQINNVLAFPGIFRGALDVRARAITEEMKTAAAYAIAAMVTDKELSKGIIVPSALNKDVGRKVALATALKAMEQGIAGLKLSETELIAKINKLIS
ncbi:MAG: NADP-dependent malic enzyme [Spirochaetales bacterium]|nr:NADP-dependent malic enzyme [Spirochaetales bacterium]